jgi:hypothetical protein
MAAAKPTPPRGPLAFVERQLESMTRRDRALLTGLFMFFGLVLLLGVLWLLNGSLRSRAAEVQDRKDELALLQAQWEVVSEAKATLDAAEARLEEYKGKKFPPFVEQVAGDTKVGDKLTVKELGHENVGNIKQTTFRVEIRTAPLEAGYDFLYELETRGFPLRVSEARLKKVSLKGETAMDVTLEVLVFSTEGA